MSADWLQTETCTLLNDDAQFYTVQSACGSVGLIQCPLVFTHRLASASRTRVERTAGEGR